MAAASVRLFVGTYSQPVAHSRGEGEGIHLYALHADGTFVSDGVVPVDVCGHNPSYVVASDASLLFIVNELTSATLSVVDVAHAPQLVDRQSTKGSFACHVTLCPAVGDDAPMVWYANYGGSVGAFALPRSTPAKLGDHVHHAIAGGSYPGANKARQDCAHAHAVVPLPGGDVLVPDLGSDCLWLLSSSPRDTAPRMAFKAVPGSGPRHAVHCSQDKQEFVYVLNELSVSVTPCKVHGDLGLQRVHDDVALAPELAGGTAFAAAIRLHPNCKWLYATVRAGPKSCIALLDVDMASGSLTLRTTIGTRGSTPRDFILMDVGGKTFAVVANQDTNTLESFLVAHTGHLEHVASTACPSPACLCAATSAIPPAGELEPER